MRNIQKMKNRANGARVMRMLHQAEPPRPLTVKGTLALVRASVSSSP
jgi:hypothetical protein